MVCDKCGKTIEGSVVELKDGTVFCHPCAKKDKKKTLAGPFVRLAKRLYKLIGRPGPFSDVIVEYNGGRCYTNGHVLLSDFELLPKTVRVFNIHDSVAKDTPYPDIAKVFGKRTTGVSFDVPEEFYAYLRNNFKTNRRVHTDVLITKSGIFVSDRYNHDPGSLSMDYREVKPGIDESITIDGAYMHALKPKRMTVCGDRTVPVFVDGSYDKVVDKMKYVAIMPTTGGE